MIRSSRLRRTALAVVLGVVVTLVSVGPSRPAAATDGSHISVMTRNLYLGADLTGLATATNPAQFIGAVTQAWQHVVATDFPTRAKALANEIELTRPDVIGLQEVSWFRQQLISDFVQGNVSTNATETVYDFLQILQDELSRRGLEYVAESTSTNADVEAPRANPDSPIGFSDVRLTDRDVILVRASKDDRAWDAGTGHYDDPLAIPLPDPNLPPLVFTRGWASIDYQIAPGRIVRILDTHLETREGGDVQVRQGQQFAELVAASDQPVIALGDFNSGPRIVRPEPTPTYDNLLSSGLQDTWAIARPKTPGMTCCQKELLDSFALPTERIDLVLTKDSTDETWHHDFAIRTGQFPFRLEPAPIWASDHFGVFALLTLQ